MVEAVLVCPCTGNKDVRPDLVSQAGAFSFPSVYLSISARGLITRSGPHTFEWNSSSSLLRIRPTRTNRDPIASVNAAISATSAALPVPDPSTSKGLTGSSSITTSTGEGVVIEETLVEIVIDWV